MEVLRPGEGPGICAKIMRNGAGCTHHEVEGLEYCVWHMPDDLLEEAEEITGWKRCRHFFGEENACHQAAVRGTDPPRCKIHGANAGSNMSKHAAAVVVEGRAADRLVAILAEHGEKLLDPAPIGNPLAELMELAAEIKAFKDLLRHVTAYMVGQGSSRYSNRYGEQLRAEIMLYERATERLAKIYIDISKLGIEAVLRRVDDDQLALVERALDAALTSCGLSLEGQEAARTALRRELARAS